MKHLKNLIKGTIADSKAPWAISEDMSDMYKQDAKDFKDILNMIKDKNYSVPSPQRRLSISIDVTWFATAGPAQLPPARCASVSASIRIEMALMSARLPRSAAGWRFAPRWNR